MNILGTIGELITAIQNKDDAGIIAAASNLKTATDQVNLAQTEYAGRALRLESAKKFKMRDANSMAEGLRKNIRESDFPGLDVIPSNLEYRRLDILLDGMTKRRKQLRSILEEFKPDYDVILMDCPPNITLLSENVFRASDVILVPVIPTVLSRRTLEQLTGFFTDEELPGDMLRPFFSMAQKRSKMHREIMADLPTAHPGFLKTVIPFSADVEQMGLHRMPLPAYSPTCAAAVAYRALCAEILSQPSLRP